MPSCLPNPTCTRRRHSLGKLLLALSLSLQILPAHAEEEIFRSVDKSGQPVFTDQGEKGGQPVTLPRTNTVPAVAPGAKTGQSAKPVDAPVYQICRIRSPENDASFVNTVGNFDVSADIQPPLRADHQVQLLVDGELYGAPQSGTEFQVSGFLHGSHTVQIRVIDAEGFPVTQSEKITIHMHQTTSRQRSRPGG